MSNEYKVDVPEGVSGIWKVSKFTVSKQDAEFDAMRGMFSGGGMGRSTPPGTYTSLHRGGTLIMSDTPDEIRDHRGFIRSATGNVLIAGLGIGMVMRAVAMKEDVKSVTVVEQSEDVIKLVADHYLAKPYGTKLDIVHADIFEWKPGRGISYDYGWFDVWDNLCTDNLDEMTKLARKYVRCVKNKGYWGKGLLQRKRSQEKRMGW
jgi:hypothetical protein